MYNLLIDIGNSDIKLAKGAINNLNVSRLNRFSYSKKTFIKDFKNNLFVSEKNLFKEIGISLLKDGNKDFLTGYFKKTFNMQIIFINRKMRLPIKIKYDEGLGNDRICNAVAASVIHRKKNILIIDYGTATTYTMVSNGVLIGGKISPGLNTSLKSLIVQTSLPIVSLSFPKSLMNTNTIDNIKAGVLFQSLFSAERTITETKKKYKNLFVIATGGYSSLMAKKTSLINLVDRDLVLKGINIIINQ